MKIYIHTASLGKNHWSTIRDPLSLETPMWMDVSLETPKFSLETPIFSLKTQYFRWRHPRFSLEIPRFSVKTPYNYWRPLTFWGLKTKSEGFPTQIWWSAMKIIGLKQKVRSLLWKSAVSNEIIEVWENLGVSNENMGVSNESMGGLQWKSWGL